MKWLLETNNLLLTHVAATWFLVGLIWMVQVVHYPLFSDVGEQGYATYQEKHQQRITWIVGPTMILELLTAVLLATLRQPSSSELAVWAWVGLGLVVTIWLVTAFVSVPCHGRLSMGFDASTHWWLVATNWIRTVAWTARGIIALVLLRGVS